MKSYIAILKWFFSIRIFIPNVYICIVICNVYICIVTVIKKWAMKTHSSRLFKFQGQMASTHSLQNTLWSVIPLIRITLSAY